MLGQIPQGASLDFGGPWFAGKKKAADLSAALLLK
jgi:hypothetical protein